MTDNIKTLLLIISVSLMAGCQWLESSKMDCTTETETKRICETEGGGAEVRGNMGGRRIEE